jgi:hypothetical protein
MDKSQRITDAIYQTAEAPSPEEEEGQATRLIDVHIYDLAPGQEEPSSIESEQAPAPATEADEQVSTEPEPHQNRGRIALLLVCVVCLILLVGGSVFSLFPLVTLSATVTILPVTRQISTISTIMVLTGHAAPGPQQIPGSTLASVTMSQQQTVSTTGKGHQDARAGHGLVTFYNSAPYTQTVIAGTLLTGNDGVQIVTDQDAIIPAVNYPTLGQATVPAHTVIAGSGGNIRAGDIYGPCCRLYVSAVNSTFTGGQPARDYQMVTRADIDHAASSLKSTLDQSIQAALKTQVANDQALITPVSCQQSITPNHQPGTAATQVQVTVSETCTGATYNTQDYQNRITEDMTQAATRQLGEGYIQVGAIQSRITQVRSADHAFLLQVKCTASYAYQFTQAQQQQIKALIAGKTKTQAIIALLQIPEIQSVSLSLSHGDQLPTDTGRIHLTFLLMA